jgi:diguanylate cyclase
MRMKGLMKSPQTLAALGLVIAAMTILALGALILVDLQRDDGLSGETIAAQRVQDSHDRLRMQLTKLSYAAHLGALAGDVETFLSIGHQADALDAEIAVLEQRALSESEQAAFIPLASAARQLAAYARSIGKFRNTEGKISAAAGTREAEWVAAQAVDALELSASASNSTLYERTRSQIQLNGRLRIYVGWLLAGSMTILVGLFLVYRRLQASARAAKLRIEQLAHFDMVTGLPNRVLLADRLEREIVRSRRSSQRFAVLLFDLDGFKAVNDTWGHAAGDRVLALVGERVRCCLRASDTVGRLGGDEFLVILPETVLEGAIAVAEKLRVALLAPYPFGKTQANLSASIGLSLFPDHGCDSETMQHAADTALYRAKQEGKNRTAVARETARPQEFAVI